ncbi:hypothetical protein BKA66DRAFT_437188 [Pyrenochaeta sp. MPI-SDFR-AT-0127]|nr:hypothetical protein BKA66DRAFT_437188 [Pyrenochaeta sp. MPI-SDFR-AT-0127]
MLTDQVSQCNASRKSHVIASRLQGFLGSIQQYCNIIDTCVGPHPIPALIWGSIKLVILTSSNFADYFNKLSERIAQFSNYCPRFSEYEKLFPNSIRLQQALSSFYAIVVSFCSRALGVVQENGIKRFSKSVWKSFKVEFKEIEERMSEAKSEISEELKLASEQEAHRFRGLLTAEVEENKLFRSEQRTEIDASTEFRSELRHKSQRAEDRQTQIIRKDEDRNSRNGSVKKLPSTYGVMEFIFRGHVIDHMKRSFAASSDTVVIYYFFDSSEKRSLESTAFLQCILHQAITTENLSPDTQRNLESLFEDQIRYSGPTTEDLEHLVYDILGLYKSAFLLIDGLDEASETEQKNVKYLLKKIKEKCGARIFATTHAAMDMSKLLAPCLSFQIGPTDNEADISTFVQSQIDQHSEEDLSGCSNVALDLIKQTLVSNAEGMFLFADLQFKVILSAYEEDGTPDRIPELLETLPQEIEDLYNLLLERVMQRSGNQAEKAKKVFQWVIHSRQPMTIEELEEAVSISTEQKSWSSPEFKLDITRLSKLCANLIYNDQATNKVMLAHHSVESFLRSNTIGKATAALTVNDIEAEQYLADVCITYLSFTDFHKAIVPTNDIKYVRPLTRPAQMIVDMTPAPIRPFVLKATQGQRSKKAYPTINVVNVLRNELSSHQSKRISPSFRILDYCKMYWHTHSHYMDAQQNAQGLSRLQNFILGTHYPKEWMPWSSIPSREHLPFWEPFIWAIHNGHTAMFHVWKNVTTNKESYYWECFWQEEGLKSFYSACFTANLEQLELLLRSQGETYGVKRPSVDELDTALIRVCRLGHEEITERLIQANADVNAAEAWGRGRTALQAAAEGGHLTVVERLLQANANVNAQAAYNGGRTALQAAAGGGHLIVVERLLQANADVNAAAAQEQGRTALQAAAGGGHLKVVERLLQANADVNAQVAYNRGRTALQTAAGGGHLKVVERLLQANANVNAQAAYNRGRTALQAAAEGGYLTVVERLLQANANVNAQASDSGVTALQAAAGRGHLTVVERLLQVNADVNAEAAYKGGRTALQAATEEGHDAIASLLHQAGAR